MKKDWRYFVTRLGLVILALVLALGCRPIPQVKRPSLPPEACRIVKHTMGETCVPRNPQRIVVLDILSLGDTVALGIKPIAAGVWSPVAGTREVTPHLTDKIKGIALYPFTDQPNLETLLLLKPDLIISVSVPSYQTIYPQLSQIAPTVLVPWVEISRDWKQHLRETAKVFDKAVVATQLLKGYDQRVQAIRRSLISVQHKQRLPFYATFVFASNDLRIAQRNSFAGTILHDIALLSPQASGHTVLPVSEEHLLDLDSDALFVGSYQASGRTTLERLQRNPLWSKVKAVQQNQVYPVDFQTWYGFDFLAAHGVLDDIETYLLKSRLSSRWQLDPYQREVPP